MVGVEGNRGGDPGSLVGRAEDLAGLVVIARIAAQIDGSVSTDVLWG